MGAWQLPPPTRRHSAVPFLFSPLTWCPGVGNKTHTHAHLIFLAHQLFVDKDTIFNAVGASHDIHLLKIDNREDELVTRANSWCTHLVDTVSERYPAPAGHQPWRVGSFPWWPVFLVIRNKVKLRRVELPAKDSVDPPDFRTHMLTHPNSPSKT